MPDEPIVKFDGRDKHADMRGTLPIYPSIESCSAATGIPVAVIKAFKREKGSRAFQASRIYLFQFLKDYFAYTESNSLTNWANEIKMEDAKRKRRENEEAERLLMRTEDVKSFLKEIFQVEFAAIDREFCNELPPTVAGLSEREHAIKAREAKQRILDELERRLQKFSDDHAPIPLPDEPPEIS